MLQLLCIQFLLLQLNHCYLLLKPLMPGRRSLQKKKKISSVKSIVSLAWTPAKTVFVLFFSILFQRTGFSRGNWHNQSELIHIDKITEHIIKINVCYCTSAMERDTTRPYMVFQSLCCVQLLQPHGLQPTRLLCPWDFPGKNIGYGLPFPSPGNLPDPGTEPRSPTLQADSLPTEISGSSLG